MVVGFSGTYRFDPPHPATTARQRQRPKGKNKMAAINTTINIEFTDETKKIIKEFIEAVGRMATLADHQPKIPNEPARVDLIKIIEQWRNR